MDMSNLLPQRWRSNGAAGEHNRAIAEILNSPPVAPQQDGLVIFSELGTMQMLPYLVALKSFWRQMRRGRVVILDDGTLTAQDRTILAQHSGDPELLRAGEKRRHLPLPAGGWEGLFTMLERRTGEYWVKLDPDTLTLGPLPEIERALASNRSFTMMAREQSPPEPMRLRQFASAFHPKGPQDGDLQMRIESRLGQLSGSDSWRYLEGSGGICGFAACGAGSELAAAFRHQLADMLGEEPIGREAAQVACNFVIANEGAPACLPTERYGQYRGNPADDDLALLHFKGAEKYLNGAYSELSRTVIAAICS